MLINVVHQPRRGRWARSRPTASWKMSSCLVPAGLTIRHICGWAGGSAVVDINTTDFWFERRLELP
jgi:hypothetical protein